MTAPEGMDPKDLGKWTMARPPEMAKWGPGAPGWELTVGPPPLPVEALLSALLLACAEADYRGHAVAAIPVPVLRRLADRLAAREAMSGRLRAHAEAWDAKEGYPRGIVPTSAIYDELDRGAV